MAFVMCCTDSAVFAASVNGATIPGVSSLVDSSGKIWTISPSAMVYVNGSAAGYSGNVVLLLYYNGKIYQKNGSGGWWSWSGSNWDGAVDPRLAVGSPSGTTIPSATQIVDSSGKIWTISPSAMVYVNGSAAGYSGNVVLLLYYNGKIYQKNGSGGWWSWNSSGWDTARDPRAPVAVNGACGSANGVAVSAAPSSKLCKADGIPPVSGSGPWTWTCVGTNGGSNASCSAPKLAVAVNGVCGSANGVAVSAAPTSGLCSPKGSPAVSGNGPFNWTCVGTNGGSNASCSAPLISADVNACLPFAQPSNDAVLNSPRKVFAHYVPWSPLSLDNKPAAQDYYAVNYLSPDGENGKFRAQGGNLRQRPLPVTPSNDPNWQILNMQKEIRMAIARGVNGFAVDTISASYAQKGGLLQMMLQAAQNVDSRFKILLVPDMSGVTTNDVKVMIETLNAHPSLYHWPDGRVVVSPFWSERIAASEWSSMINKLNSNGIRIAFIPMLSNLGDLAATTSLSKVPNTVGLANFGNPGAPEQLSWTLSNGALVKRTFGTFFFDGLTPQGYQIPGYSFVESSNSLAYRNAWAGAIQAQADMIQIVTWNDLGETTNIEPTLSSTGDVRYGFYNLTGYYATWWRNGTPPAITHDVLYYVYRKEPVSAAAPKMGQVNRNAIPGIPATDKIELLAFLTAPGTIAITIDGKTYSQSAPAGVTSFMVASAPGTPTFRLTRNGSTVINFQGGTKIYGMEGLPTGYNDLTYWSNSASARGVCSLKAE